MTVELGEAMTMTMTTKRRSVTKASMRAAMTTWRKTSTKKLAVKHYFRPEVPGNLKIAFGPKWPPDSPAL